MDYLTDIIIPITLILYLFLIVLASAILIIDMFLLKEENKYNFCKDHGYEYPRGSHTDYCIKVDGDKVIKKKLEKIGKDYYFVVSQGDGR